MLFRCKTLATIVKVAAEQASTIKVVVVAGIDS